MIKKNVTFVLGISVLILVALVPFLMESILTPLYPPNLVVTPTIYALTESAYSTRIAREEREATSVFEVIPYDEDGNPVTLTPTPSPNSSSRGQETWSVAFVTMLPTAIVTVTPSVAIITDTLTATAPLALQLYTCPFDDEELRLSRTQPPNEPFEILGWNLDANQTLYFLIEDDTTQLQVWAKIDVGVTYTNGSNYRTVYPIATSCRTWTLSSALATDEVTPLPQALGTPIPLPIAITATPLPPEAVVIEITEEEAMTEISAEISGFENPIVVFSSNTVQISGQVSSSGPLGIRVAGDVQIFGYLAVEDQELVFHAVRVTVNGDDVTEREEGQNAERAINRWLQSRLIRHSVESVEVAEGRIIINAIRYYESNLPQLTPMTTVTQATITPTLHEATVTQTPFLPQAHSITFTPEFSSLREITSSEATLSANNVIADIARIRVSFTTDTVTLTGEVRYDDTIQNIEMIGILRVENEHLVFVPTLLNVGSTSIIDTEFGDEMVTVVNTWLQDLVGGLRVNSVKITNGVLTIN